MPRREPEPEKRPHSRGEAVSPLPAMRRMTVIAQDPSIKKKDGSILMADIEVPAELLMPGPVGYRVQVVDYDTSTGRYHGAHDLEQDPPDAWRRGKHSIVADRRFHAQNVYALVMKTLARFEFALGRRVNWAFKVHQLKVAPNGLLDANAFYNRDVEGIVFGYFTGHDGEKVHTCLSHDIVVHETAHALLDALRERYMQASGPDQAAFHEGFADIIALLSVFSQEELVDELLRGESADGATLTVAQVTPEKLRKTALFGLAEQMGAEMDAVRGDALRRSAEMLPDEGWMDDPEFLEPHRRGEILVAAVLNAFLEAWTRCLCESRVHAQERHTVRSVARTGTDIANALITMWIRALDYMPPVHLEFADALTAAITADSEVRPDDTRYQLRECLLDSFASYGIAPATTRPDQRGAWPREERHLNYERVRFDSMRTNADEVFRFLWDNRDDLRLAEGAYTKVLSVHPCTRISTDGFVLHETVAQYYQVARLTPAELRKKRISLPKELVAELEQKRDAANARRKAQLADGYDDGNADDPDSEPVIPLYGGGALVFDEFGKLKYHVANELFNREQTARIAHLWKFGHLRSEADGASLEQSHLSELHRMRAMDARRFPAEAW